MRRRLSLLALFLVPVLPSTSAGQTAAALDSKYGAVTYYQIRYLSLLRPTYDANGQLCRARILPNHHPQGGDIMEVPRWPEPTSEKVRLIGAFKLDVDELASIFDELVPPAARRGKGRVSLDMNGFGGAYWTSLEYSNVIFKVDVGMFEGPRRLDMSGAEGNMDNFVHPAFGEIIAAEIVWPDRVCAERN